jgi:hypothetical protein
MAKYRNAPAFIVWAIALAAILTPPQVAASGMSVLLDMQESVFNLLVEEPVSIATVVETPLHG